MKVLSLFDGISCGYEALIRAGIPVDEYYASEIDKHAIKVALKNHPDIIEIGDVCQVKGEDYQGIDLVIGGSPCQGFSFAGKMLNFDDPRSKLFFEFVRVVKEVKPKYFLLENVKMKKEFIEVINEQLRGITPTLIDSALVSAQHRERNYRVGKLQEDGTYTKVEIPQPEDRGLLLKDVLQESPDEKYYLRDGQLKNYERSFGSKGKLQEGDKCDTITASMGTGGGNCHIIDESLYFTQEKIDQIANWKCYEKPLERAKTGEEKSDTLTTHCGKDSGGMKLVKIPCATQIGNSKNFGNAYGSEKAYTLRACNPNGVIEGTQPMRIRKLTPIECERLQTLPDNYTAYYNKQIGIKQIESLIFNKAKGLNVVLNDVKENQNGDECVLCIEEDLTNTEAQSCQSENSLKTKNVNIVIEKLEKSDEVLDECVIDTTKTDLDTETPYTLTRLKRKDEGLGKTDIIERLIEEQSTSSLWRIKFEGIGINENVSIILTLLKRIMLLKIFTYVKMELSTVVSINSWRELQQNCIRSELLLSKIESIDLMSNSQRYKALGNGWTVDTIAHIFSYLK